VPSDQVLLDGLDLPGRVDICGASHQIWHVFIFSGGLTMGHYTVQYAYCALYLFKMNCPLAMASWHYIAGWVSRQSPLSCQVL
jgi:hypothetical protein